MTIVPFPPRVPEPARTVEQLQIQRRSLHPSCDVTVTKDVRSRRYALWSDAPGRWRGEVWFDRCQHRTKRIAGLSDARMLAHQFARELRDLVADGWVES